MPESSLRYCDHSQYRRLTSGLLTLLFSREDLGKSSLTGKPCNIHKEAGPKKMLDFRKLEALVGEILNFFSRFMSLTVNRNMCAVHVELMWLSW